MTATVHTLRADKGPPETDFEREAVETLLSNLRDFRDDTGMEPSTVFFVVLGHSPDRKFLGRRTGWLNESDEGLMARMAYAGAMLSRQASD